MLGRRRISLSADGFTFDEATEVGCFSVDRDGNVYYDRLQMAYYIPRIEGEVHLDLNAGFENANIEKLVNYDCNECRIQMLRWIADAQFKVLKDVDFVSSRDTLQDILCLPYLEMEDEWTVCASMLDGVIYLKYIKKPELFSDRKIQMMSWGFKFEAYMTGGSPHSLPDISAAMPEAEKFYSLVKNKTGNHAVLMVAEIDGIESAEHVTPGETSHYVELKTTANIDRNSYRISRKKRLKWWAQSHTVGIRKIVCGFRDDEGIVHHIEEYDTENLTEDMQINWPLQTCFSFCNGFLNFIKQHVKENNHKIVYKFRVVEDNSVFVSKFNSPKEDYVVIPDWYADELKKQKLS